MLCGTAIYINPYQPPSCATSAFQRWSLIWRTLKKVFGSKITGISFSKQIISFKYCSHAQSPALPRWTGSKAKPDSELSWNSRSPKFLTKILWKITIKKKNPTHTTLLSDSSIECNRPHPRTTHTVPLQPRNLIYSWWPLKRRLLMMLEGLERCAATNLLKTKSCQQPLKVFED